jgi:iron complex outermembrane receptor protein
VVDEIRSQAWSPRAGIVFQPRPNLSLYGSFTDAFEPAYPGSLLEDGSPVTPARSHSYEAGFKADLLGSRLSFSSALYRIQREDIAEWQPGGFYRQIGEAESQGFEVELVGTLIPGLDVRPGYAYNRTEITRDTSGFTGKALRGAPRHKFNLWAKYTLSQGALRGLAVNTGVVHVGRRFTDSANEIETPAYTRLDAGVSYARGSYVFDVSIENLTDTTYIQSGWDASYWEYGNGRRTSLLVRRKF